MYNSDNIIVPSFSLKNRICRLIWWVVSFFFFNFTPRPLHKWRSFILNLFGAKIGRGVRIYPNVKVWAPWNLEIGNYSAIANDVIVYNQGKISIGEKTIISQGCHLCAGTHDYTLKSFPLITKPIEIGSDVWIAADSFIHPGISIGNGSVVGARSVVTKSMPEWMVCAGNPCKPLKSRVFLD